MILLAALWSGVLALLALHTAINAALLRRPARQVSDVDALVAVLVPVRDEAHRVRPTVRSILDQRGVPGLSLWVLDDGSTDGTADVVRTEAAGDPRLHLLTGMPPPAGWLGKPYACHQLATSVPADVPVLIFVDADVVLEPSAIAAAVGLLAGRELLSPYPRIVARGAAERLIQPLLAWSFLTFLPVRAMERSRRPSLAAAGGQFLAVTRAGYDRAGGHGAVRDRVLEDVELARAVKRSGGRIALADFSGLAATRMYGSWAALSAGYTKSLWAAVNGGVASGLILLYAVPPLGAIVAAAVGAWAVAVFWLAGYGFGVLGRAIAGAATGGRVWPDALAHPVSIVLFGYLAVRSRWLHRRGGLSWKGRTIA
jgi:glycosyltransferase involved in cell wall biosynthesis